ncbi:MAG: hypothetical protein IMF10_09290 [Proteobacteria bacterium]|nr:hypothetical protein [Pseudomonadota bacterium]
MQWVFKIGNKKPSMDLAERLSYWTDCQLVDIRPSGFYPPHKNFCIIEDDKNYWDIRGSTDWKSTKPSVLELKKYLIVADGKGHYPWDAGYNEDAKPQRVRDYFLDYKSLLDSALIKQSDFEGIYDKSKSIIIPLDRDIAQLLGHENKDVRLVSDYSNIKGSIASGTYQIGTGGGAYYATWTLFEADIAAQLTGNLTGEGQSEETGISAGITFDTDTNTHLLKLTAESGAEHNGGAYGNGARINFGSYDSITFNETNDGDLDHAEISKLALDISGDGNIGISLADGGNAQALIAQRLLVKGAVNSNIGISAGGITNRKIYNCIVYGIGDGAGDSGIRPSPAWNKTGDWNIYNNTVVECYNNFLLADGSGFWEGAFNFKNNLAQADSGGSDYNDLGAGFGTHSKNISEDATSPDAAYQSKDVHTNSVFKNYAADDYRLDSNGDVTNLAIVDDGDDLSGMFTDDIEGQTRSTWYIGASEIVAAGGIDETNKLISIVSTLSGTDIQAYIDTEKLIEIVSTIQGADVQAYKELNKQILITSTISATDIQGFIESLLIGITATISGADLLSYNERNRTIPITATISVSDLQAYKDIVNILIAAAISKTDLQAYKDTGEIPISSVLTASDFQFYVDQGVISITCTLSETDSFPGSSAEVRMTFKLVPRVTDFTLSQRNIDFKVVERTKDFDILN